MTIQATMRDGTIRIEEVTRISYYEKNPCTKCRPDGGCYDHSCFNPEDWGDFLDLGDRDPIRMQDVKQLRIVSI